MRHDASRYHFAKVKFYFTKTIRDKTQAFTLVTPYHVPINHLLKISYNTLVVCQNQDKVFWVVDIEDIKQVVAMVLFPFIIKDKANYYYLIEQIGLDVMEMVDVHNNDVNV